MLRAILNKSWQQHPTRHQLYGHLPPITKTIQVRRTRHVGHCWRSRDELIRDVLLWIPTHGRAKAGRPARTYIQQLCEDTGCCPEDLPKVMNDREVWRERVRDIRATSTIWWWWPLVRYSGPFLKWTRDGPRQIHQRTRRLMTMHKALHPRDDGDKLYVPRKERKEDLPASKTALEHPHNDSKTTQKNTKEDTLRPSETILTTR